MAATVSNVCAPHAPSAVGSIDVSVLLPRAFTLQSGEKLSSPELRLRIFGPDSAPVIIAAGGISAGKAVADGPFEAGWWRDIAAPGTAIDLSNHRLVGFDFLPNAEETARTITTRDQARALAFALTAVKIDHVKAFVGASYGGMVALAFAAEFADRLGRLCVISAADKPHPAATALRGVQRRIIEFACRSGDPQAGVSLARQIAMVSYRTPEEFAARFDHRPGKKAGDPYSVCDYLIARGEAYDMAAERYVALSDSIDRHCVEAREIKTPALFIAVSSDRLAPSQETARFASAIGARCEIVPSLYGHDAFLKEARTIGPVIRQFLEE